MNFMFAGIGDDYRNVVHKFDEEQKNLLKKLSEKAKKVYNIDIWKYLTSCDKKEKDVLTVWSSIYTCDYIVFQKYLELGLKPEKLMGYSMGLITAAACAEAISYEDGILILQVILRYHKPTVKEGMATIIGFGKEELNKIISECNVSDSIYIACENNEYCFVVSGTYDAVKTVEKAAGEKGALKVYTLDTDFAFHTDMFKMGSELLEECVNQLDIRKLKVPIISSINQSVIEDSPCLKKELINNMFNRMLWQKSIVKAVEDGETEFVEVSLGKGLTKVSKVISQESLFYSYDSVIKQKGKNRAFG